MNVTYTREGQTFALDTATLPTAAIDYLLQYGFAQSLQDSIAGRAKAVREEMLEKWTKRDDLTVDAPTEEEIAAAIKADLIGQLGKRMDAIAKGEVATRGAAEPKDPASAIVREIMLAIAKKQGKRLPKADSDEYKAIAAKVREAKADYIKAELERRAAVDIDIEL